VVIGVGAALVIAFPRTVFGSDQQLLAGPTGASLRQLGLLSLTDFLLAFELLSIILLVALLGAASLSRTANND
jgi:NADH:ubiquinone oxidoreductase subunit 6 (subunit J)